MGSNEVNLPVTKISAHVPPLEEVASVLQNGLAETFRELSVKVVDCPDLTQKPFHLAAKGICGSPRLADIGGPPYLLPLPQKDKLYDLGSIAKHVELPGAFLCGAGAGPWQIVGVNSELAANVQVSQDCCRAVCCNSHIAKVNVTDGSPMLHKLTDLKDTLNFNLMGNFLCCEGKQGKVLEIQASDRIGKLDFSAAIKEVLHSKYQTKPVALGGVFVIEKGKANLHIMPDFSCTPLTSGDAVNGWLKFFEMDAPIVCLGELVSYDPGLDLRCEHWHCFSQHGHGGHYHFDTTPSDVSYRAYLIPADFIYRIDQPPAPPKAT